MEPQFRRLSFQVPYFSLEPIFEIGPACNISIYVANSNGRNSAGKVDVPACVQGWVWEIYAELGQCEDKAGEAGRSKILTKI